LDDQFFNFYEVGIEDKKLHEIEFTAIDFETTGLYPEQDRIIEVGLVKFILNGEDLQFGSFVDPERPLPSKITEICGITQDDLSGAPKINDLMDGILEFLEGTLMIAHNINFDYGFLKKEASVCHKSFNIEYGIDTVAMAKKSFKGLQSYSLQNLARDLKLSIGEAHRALDDAILCKDLFLLSLNQIENYENLTVKELFHYSNTRIKN